MEKVDSYLLASTNKQTISQKWQNGWDKVTRDCDLSLSLLLLLSLSLLLSACSEEANYSMLNCPMVRPMCQGTEGVLWPTPSKEMRPSDLWGQWGAESANSHIKELGTNYPPVKSWLQTRTTFLFQPSKVLWARGPRYATHRILDHRNYAIINVWCIKRLNSKAICCAAIDNTFSKCMLMKE